MPSVLQLCLVRPRPPSCSHTPLCHNNLSPLEHCHRPPEAGSLLSSVPRPLAHTIFLRVPPRLPWSSHLREGLWAPSCLCRVERVGPWDPSSRMASRPLLFQHLSLLLGPGLVLLRAPETFFWTFCTFRGLCSLWVPVRIPAHPLRALTLIGPGLGWEKEVPRVRNLRRPSIPLKVGPWEGHPPWTLCTGCLDFLASPGPNPGCWSWTGLAQHPSTRCQSRWPWESYLFSLNPSFSVASIPGNEDFIR